MTLQVFTPGTRRCVLCLCLLPLLLSPGLSAEGYGDYCLYEITNIPDQVLVDTIGWAILDEPQPPDGQAYTYPPDLDTRGPFYIPGPERIVLETFRWAEGRISPAQTITAAQTFPVGLAGYGGWAKYLVTAHLAPYIQIVADPRQDRRIWIRTDARVPCRLVIPAELKGKPKPIDEELDPFLLAPQVQVYAEPNLERPVRTLQRQTEGTPEPWAVYPAAFGEGFVLIGLRTMDEHTEEIRNHPPLGWIRLRDDRGRWAVHLHTVSWF